MFAIYGFGIGKYGFNHAFAASSGGGAEYSFDEFGRR